MKNEYFSVIIPLYNKSNTITNTINSVLAQTFFGFELIVVDDGSTDDSAEKVLTIKDDRIRLIQKKNGGVSSARNLGIKEAKGKYICFLDADDYWEKDFLSTVKALFESFPEAKFASPSYKVKYEKKEIVPKWRSVDLNEDCLVKDFLEMATAPFWVITSSCVAIEKEALLSMDYLFPEKERVFEDFDLWIRLGVRFKMAHSPKVCSTYNRITIDNARTAHKAKPIYSQTYMNTLDAMIQDESKTEQQIVWLKEIKDRRLVVYLFSLLCARERKQAKAVLKGWRPTKAYKKYKIGLHFATYVPYFVIDWVQKIRYKLF